MDSIQVAFFFASYFLRRGFFVGDEGGRGPLWLGWWTLYVIVSLLVVMLRQRWRDRERCSTLHHTAALQWRMERVKVAAGSTTPERRHLMRGKHREQQHSFSVQLVKLVAKQQVWGWFGLRGHAERQGFPWMAPIWNRLHEGRCSPSVLGRLGSPTQHGG